VQDFVLLDMVNKKEEKILYHKIREGVVAPYVEFEFRGDLMLKIHEQYGHLSYPALENIFESRAWWPSMEKDLHSFIAVCPNCQTHQRQRPRQE